MWLMMLVRWVLGIVIVVIGVWFGGSLFIIEVLRLVYVVIVSVWGIGVVVMIN